MIFFVKRCRAALLLTAFALLLGGCSMVRIGYDYIDRFAAWMAVDYFDLEADQRDAFDKHFARIYAWHRRHELPDYAVLFSETQKRIRRGLTADDVHWLINSAKLRYARLGRQAAPDVAVMLATLSDAQIDHFFKAIEKDNEKFLRDYRSRDSEQARRAAQRKRALSQIEDWTGSLTGRQEERVTALLLKTPLADRLRHEDRLRRQREFRALIAHRKEPREAFTRRVQNWLVNWESGRTPEAERLINESWQKRAEFLAEVDKLLTAEQRRHAIDRLQQFIDDFRQLSGKSPAGSAAPVKAG